MNDKHAPPGKFIVRSFAASGAPPATEVFDTLDAAAVHAIALNNSEDWAVEGIYDDKGNRR
jgi:hypothetical protein